MMWMRMLVSYMIRRTPKKIPNAERFGKYRPDYGMPELEEAVSGDDEE